MEQVQRIMEELEAAGRIMLVSCGHSSYGLRGCFELDFTFMLGELLLLSFD